MAIQVGPEMTPRDNGFELQEKLNALNLRELRNAIQAGAASGPGLDALTVFERLESKFKTMTQMSSNDSAA